MTESQRMRYSSMVVRCASIVALSLRISSQGSSAASPSPLRFIITMVLTALQSMGGNQICMNVGVGRQEQGERSNIHAPNPEIYPEVGDDPSSLPCGINHIRQDLASMKLKPPEDYSPAPFSKDSFFELVRDTAYYRGEWSHGEPHGFGEVIFKDRSYFRGYFHDMQARGPECLFVLADGAYYLGAVSQSKRDGEGSFFDKGYTYAGQWLNNLPHGKGTETFPNGDSFEGRFTQGQRSGNGTYNWATGPYKCFQGIFQENMPAQKGTLLMRDGTAVQGQFDCTSSLCIAPCIIKTKNYQLSNCIVEDGVIESCVYEGRKYTKAKDSSVLKRKKLIFCSKQTSEETVTMIITQIEKGYQHARKHSQALTNIKKLLSKYHCQWWEEEEQARGVLIVEICGKKIRVSQD